MDTAPSSGREAACSHRDDEVHPTHRPLRADIRVHRTFSFWTFLLIPLVVILGWTRYASLSAAPWMDVAEIQNTGHWNEAMRYYIWLQLVWVPSNMVLFLVWCALGVRIWNCKRTLPAP